MGDQLMDYDLHSLPKVELHAHLNGSLDDETLNELHRHKYGNLNGLDGDQYVINETGLSMTNCFEKFKLAHDLTDTPERLKIATTRVIEKMAKDNTIYLELRSTPRATAFMTKMEYIAVICDTINESVSDIQVHYLPSIDRAKSVEENEDTLECVLKTLPRYDGIIVGLDLSGNPAMGSFTALAPLLARAKEKGLKLAIHCAEIAGRVEETKEMLESGLVDRIGHGTFLDETPELWSLFESKKILVECCLTSNVKCGTVASMDNHHLQNLIRINNPLAICTDDCGVFDTDLTNEFELAQETFNLTMVDLKRILIDSMKHAFCSEDDKEVLMGLINVYFVDPDRVLDSRRA